MKLKITKAQKLRQSQLTELAERMMIPYQNQLTSLRRAEVQRVTNLISNPYNAEQIIEAELRESYLRDFILKMNKAFSYEFAEQEQEWLMKDTPRWQYAVNDWAERYAGQKIVSMTGTLKASMIVWLKQALEENPKESIEEATRWIAERIAQEYEAVETWQVRRIVHTESMEAMSVGQYESIRATDIDCYKTWSITGLNTRDQHIAMEGETIGRDELFTLPNGDKMLYPRDITHGASAGNTINCCCGVIYQPKRLVDAGKPSIPASQSKPVSTLAQSDIDKARIRRHAERNAVDIQRRWNERKRAREIQAIAEQRHENRDAAKIRDKYISTRILPLSKKISTIDDIQGIIDRYLQYYPEDANNKKITLGVFKLKATSKGYAMMQAYSPQGIIQFNTSVATNYGYAKGDTPFDRLIRAIDKTRQRKSLSFDEEYAIESFYHEILHVKTKGYRVLPNHNNREFTRTAMETINQFVSRNDYHNLIERIGGKAVNQTDILVKGSGYSNWVSRLNEIIPYLSKSENEVLSYLRKELLEGQYDMLDSKLFRYIADNSTGLPPKMTINEFLKAMQNGGQEWNNIIKLISGNNP